MDCPLPLKYVNVLLLRVLLGTRGHPLASCLNVTIILLKFGTLTHNIILLIFALSFILYSTHLQIYTRI